MEITIGIIFKSDIIIKVINAKKFAFIIFISKPIKYMV